MAFDINLPRRINVAALRWAGMQIDAYYQRWTDAITKETSLPLEVQLPYSLSDPPVNISVTVLQVGDVVRLRVAAPDVAVEQDIREYLERYSAENDGAAVARRESEAVSAQINAILNREGLSSITLRETRLLNRRAIESLIELAEEVARSQRAAITLVFANGRVERADKELAARWLISMFVTDPDAFDRAQTALRISENMVPNVAEDIIRLIENRQYGESRGGLLLALARTKHPRAADVIASVLHERHMAWTGIEGLTRLKATQHVDTIRPFLRDPNPAVRRQARRALNKLGCPVLTPPKPVHLVRKPKIPNDLNEWSLGLDMDDLESTLTKLAACIEGGFGAQEIAEVMGTVEGMNPDQTKAFRFPTVADGMDSQLWLVIFLDDIDSPDLQVHANAAVIEKFRSAVMVP
jgi:hypothetical protein